jgi:CDP-glucose 4,6-dehydratase
VPWERTRDEHPHEAAYLRLDSSQARERLGWAPVVGLEAGLEATVEWYRAWREGQDLHQVTLGQVVSCNADTLARSPTISD